MEVEEESKAVPPSDTQACKQLEEVKGEDEDDAEEHKQAVAIKVPIGISKLVSD